MFHSESYPDTTVCTQYSRIVIIVPLKKKKADGELSYISCAVVQSNHSNPNDDQTSQSSHPMKKNCCHAFDPYQKNRNCDASKSSSSSSSSPFIVSCLGISLFLLPSTSSISKMRRKEQQYHNPKKNIKSVLMKLILTKDWQRFLIFAQLFSTKVHEFSIVSVPVPIMLSSSSSSSNSDNGNVIGNKLKKQIIYICMRLLPIHVACALKLPPEVVCALMTHHIITTRHSTRDSF